MINPSKPAARPGCRNGLTLLYDMMGEIPEDLLALTKIYDRLRLVGTRPDARSRYENIYHCCTQRTGSQWFRAILGSPEFYRWSGMKIEPYIRLGLRSARPFSAFAPGVIGTHLYIHYSTYAAIPKPMHYTTFFVLRDPRDIVVSWYYAALVSHVPVVPVYAMRQHLRTLSKAQGMKYIIDTIGGWGTFDAQLSWATQGADDPHVRLYRYEDISSDNQGFLVRLLEDLEIPMPAECLSRFASKYTFRNMNGRNQGVEDVNSHARKGLAGDWMTHFTPEISDYFYQQTGGLVKELGYSS